MNHIEMIIQYGVIFAAPILLMALALNRTSLMKWLAEVPPHPVHQQEPRTFKPTSHARLSNTMDRAGQFLSDKPFGLSELGKAWKSSE